MGDEDEQMFITGLVFIADFSGYTMGHFTQVPLAVMKKLTSCWEVLINFSCFNATLFFS